MTRDQLGRSATSPTPNPGPSRAGEKVELWWCPEHEWTWDYCWSPAAGSFEAKCLAYVGREETCGKRLIGPYEAVVK